MALDEAGVPATAETPPGIAGCIVFDLEERVRDLASQRDHARDEIAELTDLLRRAIKYAQEDRMQTPKSTRLHRLLAQAAKMIGEEYQW